MRDEAAEIAHLEGRWRQKHLPCIRPAYPADADQYHGQKDRRNQHKNFETKAEQKSDRQADEHYCHGTSPFIVTAPLSLLSSLLLHPRRS